MATESNYTEDLSVKCRKMSFSNGIMELEDVEIKALIISLVDKIGLTDLLCHATDSQEGNHLDDIVEFTDDNYSMESAVDCLDDERQEEIKQHLNTE